MKNINFVVVLISVLFGAGCSDNSDKGIATQKDESVAVSEVNQVEKISKGAQSREHHDWLSHKEAKIRKQRIANLQYDLTFDFTKADRFSGVSVLNFNYSPLIKFEERDLTIDFSGGKVNWVKINDEEVQFDYNNFFISLDTNLLVTGKNAITIGFSHPYSTDGAGLYRYQDQVDNRVYLYTHFEPYAANRMFPAFDQPNLRATFDLKVKAPKNWMVVSAAKEKNIKELADSKEWQFKTSPNHSTYIFPLHAGEYAVWEDHSTDIPLRLFARQSLAQYVDHKWWFSTTKKGLAFFNEYFDYEYPFGKYDQLIVPDFNIGGMENLAAVTYTEGLVSRGEVTQAKKENTARLMLHEMSHMWFGDIITIDWWSGLWLKESFATYMASLALDKTELAENAWNNFYARTKLRAYSADSLVTTHPIQMPVSDTKSGDASFDAITYSKGASVLNQLTHYLGADVFREGVRAYFKKFEYQATQLPDFMDTLGTVAKLDLTDWTNDWLYQAGANQVQVEFTCENDKINHFVVNQTAPSNLPTLRSHASQLGLYQLDQQGGQVRTIAIKPIIFSGEKTSIEAVIGVQCPDLAYPNHGDWGYMKVLLDETTLSNTQDAIALVDDPMLKAMLYQSLWGLVEAAELSIPAFIDIAMANIATENDLQVLSLVIGKLSSSLNYLNQFELETYPVKDETILKLESFFWQSLAQQVSGSDRQKIWAAAMVEMTQSQQGQNQLADLLIGKKTIKGFDIDQDYRWSLIIQLMSMGHKNALAFLESEQKKDPSHKGVLAAISAQAAMPDFEQKVYWFKEFEKENNRITAGKQKAAMRYLFPSHQSKLIEPLANRAIEDLVAFDKIRDQNLIEVMVYNLTPALCHQDSLARLEKAIKNNPQLGLIAMKGLKQMHQIDERCVKLSQFYQ